MQWTFQLPRTREVIVEFLGTFQPIREQNCEKSRKSARVTRIIRILSPSVMQLVLPWAMTADLMNTLRIWVEVNSRSRMDLTISRPRTITVVCWTGWSPSNYESGLPLLLTMETSSAVKCPSVWRAATSASIAASLCARLPETIPLKEAEGPKGQTMVQMGV